jgi:hypothetical protein
MESLLYIAASKGILLPKVSIQFLRIRDEQMAVLRSSRRRMFEEMAVSRLAHLHSGDMDAVRQKVLGDIQRAVELGFRKETDLLRWLELNCRLAQLPHYREWAQTFLTDPDLAPAARLKIVEDEIGG